MTKGHLIADVVTIIGTQDIVFGALQSVVCVWEGARLAGSGTHVPAPPLLWQVRLTDSSFCLAARRRYLLRVCPSSLPVLLAAHRFDDTHTVTGLSDSEALSSESLSLKRSRYSCICD